MKILLAGSNWVEGLGVSLKELNPNYEIDVLVNKQEMDYIEQIQSYRFLNAVDITLIIPPDPLIDNFVHNPWFNDYDHLLKIQRKNIEKRYNALNNIGKPVYCMGGTNKVELNSANYTNLINLCESIPNFLEPDWDHPDVYFAKNSLWYPINPDTPQDTIDKLIKDCDVWGELFRSDYFTIKQGNWLPNNNGYEKIVKMVKEKLNLP